MLLVRHRPTTEASLAGYLLTIADRNGLSFQQWALNAGIPDRAFLNASDVMYGRIAVRAFAGDLNLDVAALQEKIYDCDRHLKRPDKVNIFGFGELPYVLMRGVDSPLCPLCLHERHYPHRHWDIVLHTRCAKHNVRLIDRCTDCGERITWARTELNRCRCGALFTDAEPVADDLSPAHLSRDELLKVAVLVAFDLAERKGTLDLADLRELGIDLLAQKSANAWQALRDGDTAVQQFLVNALQRRAAAGGQLGCRWLTLPAIVEFERCPELQNWLTPFLDNSCKHVTLTKTLSIDSLTLEETTALLQLSLHRIKRLCAAKKLHMHSAKIGRRAMRVTAQSIADYLQRQDKVKPVTTFPSIAENKMTVTQAAAQLNIYPDAVRRIIKVGLLQAEKGKGTQVLLCPEQLSAFIQRYVFVRELATRWNMNATNLAEKLQSLNVSPVSGPTVDGALVYAFRRADIHPQIAHDILSVDNYKTRAGRRKGASLTITYQDYLTTRQVADELGTAPLKVAQLIANGFLKSSSPENVHHNRHYVHRDELQRYINAYRNNADWLAETKAASLLKISRQQLQRRHINSGELSTMSDGLCRYVRKADVDNIQHAQQHLLGVAEAATLLNRPRYVMLNLLKSKQINAVRGPSVDGSSCYYFDRQDVERLMSER